MGRSAARISARRKRLLALEEVIERHLVGFREVGSALIEIKAEKLYRETHATFELWAKERFQLGRSHAYRMIEAAKVHDNLQASGAQVLPATEFHARELARASAEQQPVVWEAALELAGDAELTEKHVRQALREAARQAQVSKLQEVSKGNQPLKGVGRHPILLADPPWEYAGGTTDPTRQIENQYPTMPLDEICALPVARQVAAKDAVLFLWATAPLLEYGFTVMRAWGFTYKTNAVWDKRQIGMGYWFRGQHEHLLVGVRGKPPKPATSTLSTSMISEKRGKHSAKPVAVYRLIEAYYPELPKVELFCRRPRKGWKAWGNQASS